MGTWRRILAALRTWPDRAGWKMVFLAVSWGLPSIALIAWAGDLAHFAPIASAATWLQVGLFLIVIPSLGEEVVFRGLFLPPPGQKLPIWRAVLANALFVAWHPFQALTFGPPWSALFLDPWFLAAAAVLGVMLTRIYRATGSLWPCIGIHWLVVASWKLLFGGPFA
ncbi:CPBP family glutamic-type intramembrane protease [Sphingomonas sp.]|uniref:CPBP family glutamic-type intramembrane protease n=1 Tax=Sphingomonas sp. TaxID=28214 RepID=UPI003D6C7675